MVPEPTFAAIGIDMGFIVRVRPCRVHSVTHVPTLDVWSRVLRGNVPGHRLPGCGFVGPTRTSV